MFFFRIHIYSGNVNARQEKLARKENYNHENSCQQQLTLKITSHCLKAFRGYLQEKLDKLRWEHCFSTARRRRGSTSRNPFVGMSSIQHCKFNNADLESVDGLLSDPKCSRGRDANQSSSHCRCAEATGYSTQLTPQEHEM